jgi:hypothetical protein
VLANIHAVSPELSTTSIVNFLYKFQKFLESLAIEMAIDSPVGVTLDGFADYKMVNA